MKFIATNTRNNSIHYENALKGAMRMMAIAFIETPLGEKKKEKRPVTRDFIRIRSVHYIATSIVWWHLHKVDDRKMQFSVAFFARDPRKIE